MEIRVFQAVLVLTLTTPDKNIHTLVIEYYCGNNTGYLYGATS